MKKTLICFLIAFLSLSVFAGATKPWKIDKSLKFSMVYFNPSHHTPINAKTFYAAQPMIVTIPDFEPDISNIIYQGLLDLNFPLPKIDHADEYRFLLKLYNFPDFLNFEQSVQSVLQPFSLHLMENYKAITSFASKRYNLAIKHALVDRVTSAKYTSANPLPKFQMHQLSLPERQLAFESAIPFTSLYVLPGEFVLTGKEKDDARLSAKGVEAFHKEVLNSYREAFIELNSDKKSYFFARANHCPKEDKVCGLLILEVPKAPMIFENYREMPMPSNPKKHFLSALLLLKSTGYYVGDMNLKASEISTLDLKRMQKTAKTVSSLMMEVGSVFDTGLKKDGKKSLFSF